MDSIHISYFQEDVTQGGREGGRGGGGGGGREGRGGVGGGGGGGGGGGQLPQAYVRLTDYRLDIFIFLGSSLVPVSR